MTDTHNQNASLRDKIARAAYENRVALIESDAERQNWPAWDEHEEADADEWRDMADAVLAVLDLDEVRANAARRYWPVMNKHLRKAKFDRMLAQVKAEAQVEALREVAKDREWLDAAARTGMNEYGGPFAWNAAKGVRDRLYDRAARIARAAGIDNKGESE